MAYCGLNNLGNTCYMNSLLQTLFMTRQFREALFKWRYNPQQHPDPIDCIPYQLQLLFARMQEADLSNTDAKALIRSFQWDAQESFVQHDVQEFCRVLFEAIQQSGDDDFINTLYQSQQESFVHCSICNQESVRSDVFLDLSLTVKSDLTNVYNESLEKALYFFLKPEKLDGNNLYFCENCQTKVEATKGFRLKQLSDILTIQLNRFEIDLETFQRKKVNDYVSYPFVLDMNNFLKPHEQIVIQDEIEMLAEREKLKQEHQKQRASRAEEFDNPLRRRPMNRRPSPGDTVKKVSFSEAPVEINEGFKEIQNSKLKESHGQLDQRIRKILGDDPNFNTQPRNQRISSNDDTQPDRQSNQTGIEVPNRGQLANQATVMDMHKMQVGFGEKKFLTSTVKPNPNLIMTADEAYEVDMDLDNDPLFGKVSDLGEMPDIAENNDSVGINKVHKSKEITGSHQMRAEDAEQQILYQIEDESHNLEIQQKIKQLLNNGPYVYELYSIMVHSGGALGGHYYSYIKSFEDDRWYCFNDSHVQRIRWIQVTSMFGDKFPKYNSGSSAYFLMYRKVGEQNKAKPQLTQWVATALQKDLEEMRLREELILQQRREKEMELRLRCFYKLNDKVLIVKKDYTLEQLKDKIHEELEVFEEKENTRVRFFNHHEMLPQETFTGKEKRTLQELHFNEFKSVLLETKQSHEVFTDFDPHLLTLKVVVWNPDIESLDNFNPMKLMIKDDKTVGDLEELISQKTGIPVEKQIILSRNLYNTNSFSVRLNQNSNLQITSLKLGKQPTIYVEEQWTQERPFWDERFEMEKYKCIITFNDPRKSINLFEHPDFCFQLQIDTRKNFGELRDRIADFLGIDPESFIMKRTQRMGVEFKDMNSKIKDNQIVSRGVIYVQMGKPGKQGIYKAEVQMVNTVFGAQDSIEYLFQDIGEIQINAEWTGLQLKEKIKETIEIDPKIETNLIRLRLRHMNRLQQVIKDQDELKQYLLYDKMKICIERIEQPEVLEKDDLLLYVRFYNIKDFTLSAPVTLFVKSSWTLDWFSEVLSQKFSRSRDVFEGIKINNIMSFAITDLVIASYDWVLMRYNQQELGKPPWYILKDANHLIVRDARDVPMDMTDLRKKCDDMLSKSTDPTVQLKAIPPQAQNKPKEKVLKITVKKQKEQQEAQPQAGEAQGAEGNKTAGEPTKEEE